jgi:hypothetical protein
MGILGHDYGVNPDYLNDVFYYDPQAGDLKWKKTFNKYMRIGKIAGTKSKNGVMVGLMGKIIPARRIVWAMHNGEWPDGNVKHIDKNRHNNRIENLSVGSGRKSTGSQKQHRTLYSTHTLIPVENVFEYFYLDSKNCPRWKKKAGPRAAVDTLAGKKFGEETYVGFMKLLIPAQKIVYVLLNGNWPELSS